MTELVEPYGKVVINFPDKYGNSKSMGYPIEFLYAHEFNQIMDSAGFDLWARIIWDKNKVFIDGANHLAHPNNKIGQMRVAPNWEYIFVWRKHSQPAEVPVKKVDMTDEERIAWTDSIWTIDSVTVNEKEHGFKLAKFPEEIPYRLIKMYTEPGDLVVDPFGGTCTTTYVANNLERRSVCIEKNPLMETYIRNYLGVQENAVQEDMFTGIPDIEFIHFQEWYVAPEDITNDVYVKEFLENPPEPYNYELSDFLYDANRERRFFG